MKSNPNTPIPKILNDTFVETDKQLAERKMSSGCTVIVAVVCVENRPDVGKCRVLYTANVGDARAVLRFVF